MYTNDCHFIFENYQELPKKSKKEWEEYAKGHYDMISQRKKLLKDTWFDYIRGDEIPMFDTKYGIDMPWTEYDILSHTLGDKPEYWMVTMKGTEDYRKIVDVTNLVNRGLTKEQIKSTLDLANI